MHHRRVGALFGLHTMLIDGRSLVDRLLCSPGFLPQRRDFAWTIMIQGNVAAGMDTGQRSRPLSTAKPSRWIDRFR
jgi:hypothetical protein